MLVSMAVKRIKALISGLLPLICLMQSTAWAANSPITNKNEVKLSMISPASPTDLYYTFKSGTKIGGKYGTTIAANFSYYSSLNDSSDLLSVGKEKYFSDANIELRKNLNKKMH